MVRNIVNNNVVALQKQFYTFVILLVLSTHSVYATIHSYGIIEESTGRVEIMPEGSVLWHSASNGMRLNHNDRIRTFSDSGCRLFFHP